MAGLMLVIVVRFVPIRSSKNCRFVCRDIGGIRSLGPFWIPYCGLTKTVMPVRIG